MRFLKVLVILLIATSLIVSCKKSHKELNPELFIEIENEILKTDLTPKTIEKIVEGYGITLKQFREYEERVETDPKLKEQIGEIRLNQHKKENP